MEKKCSKCGLCCKLFLINLSKAEYQSGKYKTIFMKFAKIKSYAKAQSCGANLLAQKKDGSCIYLKDKLCAIHDNRPRACRDFFCTSKSKRFKGMIELIETKRGKSKQEQ